MWEVRKTGADAWLLAHRVWKADERRHGCAGGYGALRRLDLLLSVGAWYREKKDGMPVLMHLTDKGRG